MDIYCIRNSSGILALADFRKLDDTSISSNLTEPSSYVLSSMLSNEEEVEVCNRVIRGVDRRIDYWIQEKRYSRRLLLSAMVFLLVYFLCSLVVRDPIPLIDELLVSSVASVFTWCFLSKRDLKAKEARELKTMYHKSLESAELKYSTVISEAEQYYSSLEAISHRRIADVIASGELPVFEGEVSKGLINVLDSYLQYSKKLERRYISEINSSKHTQSKLQKSLIQDYSTGNLDIYFLAFCLGYSRNQ